MKTINFEPTECKEGKLKGHVVIDMPNYIQRLQYVKECNFQVKDGEVSYGVNNIDALVKMIEVAKKHVKEVHLKKGKEEFKSFDDLLDDAEMDGVVNEVAGAILNGIKLGKN